MIVQAALLKAKQMFMGPLQNAVFRPKREICALKKLVRTAALTVLTNFFFDLIFQNPILQQAHFLYGMHSFLKIY